MKTWSEEKQAEYNKEYQKRNKEKIKEYQHQWYQDNKESIKNYLEDNKEKIKEKSKQYRNENKDKIKELWKEWYKNNPERSVRRRFMESKNKATKRRELTWTLSFEEYSNLVSLPCYYCDYKLGTRVTRSCGLDRLNSEIGYETNNVVSCCMICNTIKNEHLTPEETKAAVSAILKLRTESCIVNTPL